MARILIVEDEVLIATMLVDWVRELGHEAIGPVVSVDQALDWIVKVPIDAAILDLNGRLGVPLR
jgi:DNA-binding response OmpR family regulator